MRGQQEGAGTGEFLGFVQAESTTGQALVERFQETQQGYGLDIDHMHAQGCDDRAANMAAIHSGVQAIIRHRVPDAVYVHCKAHSLNLAIGHACKEHLVRNMLGTLQQIPFAFHYSVTETVGVSGVFVSRCGSKTG